MSTPGSSGPTPPAPTAATTHLHAELTDRQAFVQTSFREPALSAASQAGLVNNLNDGLAWGLFPVLFAAAACRSANVGSWSRSPAVWGLGQLVTGALSDRSDANH